MKRENVLVRGMRVSVAHAGGGGGEAVVFVHGAPGASDEWEPLAQVLPEGLRVIAPDLPGYGASERPRRHDWSSRGVAAVLGDLLNHYGIERVHLVVHDFGGPPAFEWAVDHLHRVASLTTMSVGVMPGFRWHAFGRVVAQPGVGEAIMSATRLRPLFDAALRQGSPLPLPAPVLARIHRDWDSGTRRAVRQQYRHALAIGEEAAVLARRFVGTTFPVLIVWGREDPFVDWAERQREVFPHARVEYVDGSGHWPWLDAPQRCGELLADFLGDVREEA